MKRLTIGLMVLFVLALIGLKKVSAGTPQEQGANLTGAFSHTNIYGSTSTVNTSSLTVTIPALSGYSNCFTRFTLQISTASTFTVYDGTSTNFAPALNINGIGLSTSGINTLNIVEDHLGPLCLTNGSGTLILLNNGNSLAVGAGMGFNYEGYTTAGPGSSRN